MKYSILLITLLTLTGCAGMEIPTGMYGCIDLDGYFTDSEGRIIKVPEGTVITTELIEEICP